MAALLRQKMRIDGFKLCCCRKFAQMKIDSRLLMLEGYYLRRKIVLQIWVDPNEVLNPMYSLEYGLSLVRS
jgi:hypothetical protein